jgi:hypothetical protein
MQIIHFRSLIKITTMNINLKLIIIGFALMIFGGIMFIISGFSNLSPTLVLMSYGYLLGFILIVIGVIKHPNDHNEE